MFWDFVLCKHILQSEHILSIKEENNFHTVTCKLLWDDGTSSFRYGKIIHVENQTVQCSRQDSFSNPGMVTSKYPVILWPPVIWLKAKIHQPVALKGHCFTEVSDQDTLYYLKGDVNSVLCWQSKNPCELWWDDGRGLLYGVFDGLWGKWRFPAFLFLCICLTFWEAVVTGSGRWCSVGVLSNDGVLHGF